jgi:hypothetical protein
MRKEDTAETTCSAMVVPARGNASVRQKSRMHAPVLDERTRQRIEIIAREIAEVIPVQRSAA